MKKKIIFMGEKQKEYSRLAERHSASLKMSGYRKELNHDAILELKVSLDNARENELRPLKAKLESYRGLPPNPGDLTYCGIFGMAAMPFMSPVSLVFHTIVT